MRSVPPSFWERHFDNRAEDIIDTFQKDTTGKKFLPGLIIAITKFRDTRWALLFMQHSQVFYIDIIPLLPAEQQDRYSTKFFEKFPDDIASYATRMETEWSLELAKNIFRHAAKNPYQYNRQYFNQHIGLIPVHIAGELERCTPAEDHLRTMWSNLSEYIIKLITLKIQTVKAFNS